MPANLLVAYRGHGPLLQGVNLIGAISGLNVAPRRKGSLLHR